MKKISATLLVVFTNMLCLELVAKSAMARYRSAIEVTMSTPSAQRNFMTQNIDPSGFYIRVGMGADVCDTRAMRTISICQSGLEDRRSAPTLQQLHHQSPVSRSNISGVAVTLL